MRNASLVRPGADTVLMLVVRLAVAAMQFGEPVYYPPQYERSHPKMRAGDFLKPRADSLRCSV